MKAKQNSQTIPTTLDLKLVQAQTALRRRRRAAAPNFKALAPNWTQPYLNLRANPVSFPLAHTVPPLGVITAF